MDNSRLDRFVDWAAAGGSRVAEADLRRLGAELIEIAGQGAATPGHVDELLRRCRSRLAGPQAILVAKCVADDLLRFEAEAGTGPVASSAASSSPPGDGAAALAEGAPPGAGADPGGVPPEAVRPIASDPPAPSERQVRLPAPILELELPPPSSPALAEVDPPAAGAGPAEEPPPGHAPPSQEGEVEPPPPGDGAGAAPAADSFRCAHCKVFVRPGADGACPQCGNAPPQLPPSLLAPGTEARQPRGQGSLLRAVIGLLLAGGVLLMVTKGSRWLRADEGELIGGTHASEHLGVNVTFPAGWRHVPRMDASEAKGRWNRRVSVFYEGASATRFDRQAILVVLQVREGEPATEDDLRTVGASEMLDGTIGRRCDPVEVAERPGTLCASVATQLGRRCKAVEHVFLLDDRIARLQLLDAAAARPAGEAVDPLADELVELDREIVSSIEPIPR